jgi:hypothetical protein
MTCEEASKNGQIECLKYAHTHGCPWDEMTCEVSAGNGHLDCLQYAVENGCPWNKWTCELAAYNGHLNCLEYAHTHGCPWDESICAYSAMKGKLDCLIYAHIHGCPWDEKTCEYAIKYGHLDCFKYAVENECHWNKEECLKIAIKNNKTSIVNYIKNLEKKDENEIFNNEAISLNCESCKVNKKCVIYEPCNHLLSCWSCAVKTKNCISCNKEIFYFFKIFFP